MRKNIQVTITSSENTHTDSNPFEVDLVVLIQEPKGQSAIKLNYLAEYQREAIRSFFSSKVLSGKWGELLLVRTFEGLHKNTLYIGLGSLADLNIEKFRKLGAQVFNKLKQEKLNHFSIRAELFDQLSLGKVSSKLSASECLFAFLEGIFLTDYKFNFFQEIQTESVKISTPFIASSKILTSKKLKKDLLLKLIHKLQNTIECVFLTRDWSNLPSNIGTPEYYAQEALKIGKHNGLKVRVLSEGDARKEKMNLFLAVGQGSEREGKIVVLEYIPTKKVKTKTVVLVGKGVTFDSGGISIKPALRMEEMKHDMTGAATVLGAVLLAAKQKSKNKVVGILALTENMPSGTALQPGNIIQARNGKTVEIINTDAEGRLILADVLDYSYQFSPSVVIDIATLTGAVNVALGKQLSAIFSQGEKECEKINEIGNYYFERMWRLPLYEEYFEDLKTEHADMKNAANDPAGGTIRAALFLKQFIKKEVPWIHIDIASTATSMGHIPYYPKRGASGGFVRTLAQFACEY